MKEITGDLKFKIQSSRAGLKKCKWDEIYDTEEELEDEKDAIENALDYLRDYWEDEE